MSPIGPRILLVDDDAHTKESLADMVQGEGWAFNVADTVEEALAAVEDLGPEVIVLEPRAEAGKAVSLLVSLRQRSAWTPVILYTDDPAYDEQYALEHGASRVVRKSGGLATLRGAIADALADEATDRPL
jgi:DNA-binding NtrC family response regulator